MNCDKLLTSLGLARKAGALILGNENVHEAVRKNKAVLVLLARDASQGSKKKLITACTFYNVSVLETQIEKSALADALGCGAACAAVAVKNHEIIKLIQNNL